MTHSSFYTAIVLFLLFLVIAIGLHGPGLNAPMRYDSAAKLEGRSGFLDQGAWSAIKVFPQRPLPILTFYANYVLDGMNPAYFRVVNLAVLAMTAVVVVLLMSMVLAIPGLWGSKSRYDKSIIGILAGLLFLVHPLQTYVTLYVWQRVAIMVCFFYYSALAVYLAVRLGHFRNKAVGYGLCLTLSVCALLSKENAITLPVAFILIDIGFFRETGSALWKRTAVFLAMLILVGGMLSFLQYPHGDVRLGNGVVNTVAAYYRESGLTSIEVLLTQTRMLFRYLALSVAPLPGTVQLVSPQIVSHSLWEPPTTFLAVLATFALVTIGIYLLKKRPLSGFGILFYVLNFIPEALLVPQYAFFGYRAVLPMFGLLLVLVDCVAAVLDAVKGSRLQRPMRAALLGSCIAAVAIMGAATVERARIWSDEVRFWKEIVKQFPPPNADFEIRVAVQVLSNLGRALYKAGAYQEALQSYERALTLSPKDPMNLASLGSTYAKLGNPQQAETCLREALKIRPDLAYAHGSLGDLLIAQNRRDEGLKHLQKAANLLRSND